MSNVIEVKRKANVGERIKIVAAVVTFGDYRIGTEMVVEIADYKEGRGVFVEDYGVPGAVRYVLHREYVVLEESAEATPTTAPSLTKQLEGLTETVAKLALQLKEAREDIVLIEEGLRGELAELKRAITSDPVKIASKSPELSRDSIVERAKADVADLRKFSGTKIPNDTVDFWPEVSESTNYIPMHTVEYIVNRDKRTVVAIIRCTIDGHITRGKSRCAPDDCFNVHLGKAIALRRALGLTVPDEYYTAPQPTEARVGTVIATTHSPNGYTLIRDWDYAELAGHSDFIRIIDDSRGLTEEVSAS